MFNHTADVDFNESYNRFYNPGVKAADAYQMYLYLQGDRLQLPKRKKLRMNYLGALCAACRSPSHKLDRCERFRSGEFEDCDYAHDGVTDLQHHSISMCPILHNFRSDCFMGGHHEQAHHIKAITQCQLRERFFEISTMIADHFDSTPDSSTEGENDLAVLEVRAGGTVFSTIKPQSTLLEGQG